MKIKPFNKKAGTPIDTTILVLLTLALSIASIFIFYYHSNYVSSKIQDSRFLEETYVKETKLDFYINDIFDKSILKISDKTNPIPEFIIEFKNELAKYKTNETYVFFELKDLENISIDNIKFENNSIILSVNTNIKQDYNTKYLVNYNYNKKFIRKIN